MRMQFRAAWGMIAAALLTAATPAVALQWSAENGVSTGTTVALYHFNGSGTNLIDSSLNGFHMHTSNVNVRAGASPGWLVVPSGDYLEQGPNGQTTNENIARAVNLSGIDFDQGLTVSLWYRALDGTAPYTTNGGAIVGIEGAGAFPRTSVGSDAFGSAGLGRMRLTGGGGGTATNLVDFGPTSVWRHLAVVYDPLNGSTADGGRWRFYLDNSEVSTVDDPNNYSAVSSFDFKVGDSVFNNTRLQLGAIDEVLVENQVLIDFSAQSGGDAAIPTLSEWGMIILFAALVVFGLKRIKAMNTAGGQDKAPAGA